LRAVFDAERRADFFAERREVFLAAVRLRPRVLLLLLRAFDFAFRLAIRTPFRSIHHCNGRHERGHCATTARDDQSEDTINFERPRRDNSDGPSAELASESIACSTLRRTIHGGRGWTLTPRSSSVCSSAPAAHDGGCPLIDLQRRSPPAQIAR
jgi:hypothetical protein